MRRALAALILALSTIPSVSPASAVSPITFADIYNPAKIIRVDFTLPQSSVAALNTQATLENYVPGQVAFSLDKKASGPLDIKLRLKGSTSLQKLDWSPSFKIKFPAGPAALGYLGLRRMTLNAMTQDGSKLHEYAAYALFNAMGLPASKTGWAKVYVNGIYKGLYINVETPDETFMSRRFKDITQHIYEGAGSDFWMGSDWGDAKSGPFLVDYGWKVTPNKYDLNTLIAYTYEQDKTAWYKGLTDVLDRPALIKFMAVENYISHWDGYSGPDKNNYFIRSNTKGKFSFIPWGTDQTFGENRATGVIGDYFTMSMLSETSAQPWAGPTPKSRLFVHCLNNLLCRKQYLSSLKSVAAKVNSMNLNAKVSNAARIIEPVLMLQYGNNMDTLKWLNDIHVEQNSMLSFIATRQIEVAGLPNQ